MGIERICFFGMLLPLAAAAAALETGAVIRSGGGEMFRNTIPQVARLGNNELLAVFSTSAKGVNGARIYASFSRDNGRTWATPRVLMSPPEKHSLGDPNLLVDGSTVMVFATRVNSPNRIDKSWTVWVRSEDNGATWSDPGEIPIPRQYVSGKQHNGLVLHDGSYIMGVAWDKWPEKGMAARSEGEMDLTAGVLISKDRGAHWTLHGALHADYTDKLTPGGTNGLCEPTMVELSDGELLMILRSGSSFHYQSRSRDGGLTWSQPERSPLTGHNTPTALLRLRDSHEIVAVWNPSPLARYPLSVALSSDGGKTWSTPRILAQTAGLQVSYPGLTQAADGTLVAVWQQALADGGRDIRFARFTREWILTGN